MAERCSTCHFGRQHAGADGANVSYGSYWECHKTAPKAYCFSPQALTTIHATWPRVPDDEWCGDYAASPQVTNTTANTKGAPKIAQDPLKLPAAVDAVTMVHEYCGEAIRDFDADYLRVDRQAIEAGLWKIETTYEDDGSEWVFYVGPTGIERVSK